MALIKSYGLCIWAINSTSSWAPPYAKTPCKRPLSDSIRAARLVRTPVVNDWRVLASFGIQHAVLSICEALVHSPSVIPSRFAWSARFRFFELRRFPPGSDELPDSGSSAALVVRRRKSCCQLVLSESEGERLFSSARVLERDNGTLRMSHSSHVSVDLGV
jgi:hypothetical protein